MTIEYYLKAQFYGEGTDAVTPTSRVPLLDSSGNPIGSTTLDSLADTIATILAGTNNP